MQLVIEGTDNLRRIISVGIGTVTYTLGPDQIIRTITDVNWLGWRKSEIHWDEGLQQIIIAPYPLSAEEKETKRIEEVNAKISKEFPDIMRILANDPAKGFDDLMAEIKSIDDGITIEAVP